MAGGIGIALDIGQAALSENIQIPFDIRQAADMCVAGLNVYL